MSSSLLRRIAVERHFHGRETELNVANMMDSRKTEANQVTGFGTEDQNVFTGRYRAQRVGTAQITFNGIRLLFTFFFYS